MNQNLEGATGINRNLVESLSNFLFIAGLNSNWQQINRKIEYPNSVEIPKFIFIPVNPFFSAPKFTISRTFTHTYVELEREKFRVTGRFGFGPGPAGGEDSLKMGGGSADLGADGLISSENNAVSDGWILRGLDIRVLLLVNVCYYFVAGCILFKSLARRNSPYNGFEIGILGIWGVGQFVTRISCCRRW